MLEYLEKLHQLYKYAYSIISSFAELAIEQKHYTENDYKLQRGGLL